MAYQAPTTKAPGQFIDDDIWNQDVVANQNAAFPLGVAGWTSYTPTLTQSGAVTKTATQCAYMRVGRLIVAHATVTCTGAGTAGQAIKLGLPVAARVSVTDRQAIGTGHVLDVSANAFYAGTALLQTSTTEVAFVPHSADVGGFLGEVVMAAALASADVISMTVTYEAAS